MTKADLEAQCRELIGSPDLNSVTNDQLDRSLGRSLNWLALKLRFDVRTDDSGLALTAGLGAYALPPDLAYMVYAKWNQQFLVPKSTWTWERDGVNLEKVAASKPAEFAILARTLYLNPAPDATSVSTDGYLHYRAVFTQSSIPDSGVAGLSEADNQLLVFQSAVEYLGVHPDEVNQARMQYLQSRVNDLLPAAIARATNIQEAFFPGFRPFTGRLNAAR